MYTVQYNNNNNINNIAVLLHADFPSEDHPDQFFHFKLLCIFLNFFPPSFLRGFKKINNNNNNNKQTVKATAKADQPLTVNVHLMKQKLNYGS